MWCRRLGVAVAVAALAVGAAAGQTEAQTRRKPAAKPAAKPKPPAPKPLAFTCPAELGKGASTTRVYCDVLTGRTADEGILLKLPARRGTATLRFDLHNRHTYSEQLVEQGKAFREYTASVGVLAPDGTMLARAAVQSTFRAPADLLDRVQGGAGPGGLKAVAPVGSESIVVEIPQELATVSLVGERLTVHRIDGVDTFSAPGRPIAIISNVTLEYTAAPAPKRPARKTPARTPRR
jgi:hypothetical protein